MNRKKFLQSSLLGGAGALLLPQTGAAAILDYNLGGNGIDRLTDTDGNFLLQPLPYAETFLEPNMDAETLHLHYTFHHGGAVKKANAALQKINESLAAGNYEGTESWTKKLSFNFSSHILHTIFWTNLSATATQPKGELLRQIERSFGSLDKLKGLIAQVSKNVEGNGWGILGWQPYADRLSVLQCENHEKLTQWGIIPLLVIDVWEHAYYLKFRNKRDVFVDNLFAILNWDNVAERLETAMKLRP